MGKLKEKIAEVSEVREPQPKKWKSALDELLGPEQDTSVSVDDELN